MMKPLSFTILIVLIVTPLFAVDYDYAALEEKMLGITDFYSERAIHPETHLLYQKVDLHDPDRWENTEFPDKSLIDGIMCADRYTPNVANCAISGGRYMGLLCDAYDVTGHEPIREQARILFDGLRHLASVSPRKGFIARCVLPIDKKTHYLNSSVDQYTYYVYGLYKYYFSPLSGKEEKADIRRIINDICTMIARDGTILTTDGRTGRVSDIEVIRSDRSSRMLEMFMVGWAITGRQEWRDYYLERVQESDYARFASLLDPELIIHPYQPRDSAFPFELFAGSVNQTQYSLVPLIEKEPELPYRTVYLEAMRINASLYEKRGRVNARDLHIIMLAENRDIKGHVKTPAELEREERLLELTISLCSEASQTNTSAAELFWAAVKAGIIKKQ